jgi:phosphoglycolate phosphatase
MAGYQAVLFDLDGTLADTAPDLANALNLMRLTRGMKELPLDVVRPHASAGARGLLKLGFSIGQEDPRFESMRTEFLDLYERNLAAQTVLFPGMSEVLAELEGRKLRWGVVTNKPQRFTLPLMKALRLSERSACIVCADMVAAPKPHPAPLLEAARRLELPPSGCLYVGDDQRDMVAATAAGMDSVVALYGYLGDGEPPAAWRAAGMIASPRELLRLPGVHP